MLMGGEYMKTIMKYELIINEALRSALNYDMPEDEINEFIRFFGKHIGSDRIYIFEDKDGMTKNTYEWCRNGIEPQIHKLQAVNMDIIDWWYEHFDRGESIIVNDIEDIKEKCKALGVLMKVQTGEEHEIDDKMASAVNVIKIDVESYTAKACIR